MRCNSPDYRADFFHASRTPFANTTLNKSSSMSMFPHGGRGATRLSHSSTWTPMHVCPPLADFLAQNSRPCLGTFATKAGTDKVAA